MTLYLPRAFRAVLLGLLTVFAADAASASVPASAPEGGKQPAPEIEHRASLTFAPLLALDLELSDGSSLLLPELTYEHRLAEDVSVAGIATLGRYKTPGGDGVLLYGAGLQGRYYLVGDFDHGLGLALHALFLGASTRKGDASAVAQGLQVGPAVGYKVAARFGLTFDVQLGAAYLAAMGRAESSATGESVTASDSGFGPLLRLNLGWSF